MQTFDLAARGLRELNQSLHALKGDTNQTAWDIINTKGSHAIAVGVDAPVEITVHGTTGYYCAGMNKQATIRIKAKGGTVSFDPNIRKEMLELPGMRQALAHALVALSHFAAAHAHEIDSVEINPFIALPQGGCAVDALIVKSSR